MASAPRESAGGRSGSNPLAQAITGAGGDKIAEYQYQRPTGLPSLLLHGLLQGQSDEVTDRNQAKFDKAKAEQQGVSAEHEAAVSAGVASYQTQLEKAGGDPRIALPQFLQTPEGHTVFTKPDVFNAVMAMHHVATATQFDPNSPPQITDLGKGLVGVNVGGAWKVMPSHEATGARADKPIKGPDGNLYVRDPNSPTNLLPMTVGTSSGGDKPAGPPEHFGPRALLQSQSNWLTAAPEVYQGLQVMGALSGKATGLPTGFFQHLGGVYLGVNDPAAAWDIAKRQVENGAAKMYAGQGGGGTAVKEFISNLPTYNDAPRFNVAASNSLQRSVFNETKRVSALSEQKAGGSLPLVLQTDLEKMGIYASSKQDRDPWNVLQKNPHSLTEDQLDQMVADRNNHSPAEQAALVGENDRRLTAAQSQAQPQATPTPQPPPATPPNAGVPQGDAAPAPTGPISPEQAAQRYLSGQASPQSLALPQPPLPGQPPMPGAPQPQPQDSQGGASAPLPPAPGTPGPQGMAAPEQPQPPQQQSMLSSLNPIASAQAAEQSTPPLPPEMQQLQQDISKAAQIAPDPKSAELIAATHKILEQSPPAGAADGGQ